MGCDWNKLSHLEAKAVKRKDTSAHDLTSGSNILSTILYSETMMRQVVCATIHLSLLLQHIFDICISLSLAVSFLIRPAEKTRRNATEENGQSLYWKMFACALHNAALITKNNCYCVTDCILTGIPLETVLWIVSTIYGIMCGLYKCVHCSNHACISIKSAFCLICF